MLVILFRLLSFLPLPVLHAIGSALGWVVYLAAPRYRRHLRDNIRQAGFGDQLPAAIAEAGKNMLELPFIWCASPQRVLKTARIENWAAVQAAMDARRGIIFLTPHLGCFEISAQVAAAKLPLTVMYRPPRQQALKPLIEDARARQNLSLAPANLGGVRALFKVVKRGGAIGLLPDQVPQTGEGVWAEFFGKPAYTMTLPAKMLEMTGAAMILTYAERLPRGKGYTVHFQPFQMPDGLTQQQQVQAINVAMEALIAHCPAQYFWSYNHYKIPAGVAAPDDTASSSLDKVIE
ncbi:lysophospholipid acyltransferase family protein [Herminiimonas sp.]|uniref:lysophospholipid acyltransferase family protein n=1 Tax=Herminiimonas sp. TaxID=1926289 RepID=UPI00271E4ED9|nr:lysophospholipid acyltransferase family protein [Herminiimonas sp.]MDO8306167.1 lysophospholipid acyltransferase family protein [Herminiimonas sp.]